MSAHAIIFIIAIIIVVVIAASRIRRGPRVKQITRTREKKDEDQ